VKIELHMIQNFAPSCLNRDDTNSPKDCIFGGVRRARISSQCVKRAIRRHFREQGVLPPGNLAQRTKRLVEKVTERLVETGKAADQARQVVQAALGALGLAVADDSQTQYLLFLSEVGMDEFAALCGQHWETLVQCVGPSKPKADDQQSRRRSARKQKKAAKDAVPDDLAQALGVLLDGGKAADLALFGRMLADLPRQNIDAACQVAHAISTHKVAMEMDFYTAVDDLKGPEEDAGAGMMGVIGYNAACFYRYAVLDWQQLLKNLGDDGDVARRTVEAFLRASAIAVPSGKQNTFAAHSRPDFILAIAHASGAPLSLANAFTRPARPWGDKDLTQASVDQLAEYYKAITDVFGADGVTAQPCCGTVMPSEDGTGWQPVKTLDELVVSVLAVLDQGAAS